MQLSSTAERLAQLHSGLLRCCSTMALAAELDLLMNLLAVPASVHVDPQLSHITLLWCGELAQQYACCVLQAGGELPLLRCPAHWPAAAGALAANPACVYGSLATCLAAPCTQHHFTRHSCTAC